MYVVYVTETVRHALDDIPNSDKVNDVCGVCGGDTLVIDECTR